MCGHGHLFHRTFKRFAAMISCGILLAHTSHRTVQDPCTNMATTDTGGEVPWSALAHACAASAATAARRVRTRMAASTCVESVRWRPRVLRRPRAHLHGAGVAPQACGLPGDAPGPERARHRVVEAGIGHRQAQGGLPVTAAAHGGPWAGDKGANRGSSAMAPSASRRRLETWPRGTAACATRRASSGTGGSSWGGSDRGGLLQTSPRHTMAVVRPDHRRESTPSGIYAWDFATSIGRDSVG